MVVKHRNYYFDQKSWK